MTSANPLSTLCEICGQGLDSPHVNCQLVQALVRIADALEPIRDNMQEIQDTAFSLDGHMHSVTDSLSSISCYLGRAK